MGPAFKGPFSKWKRKFWENRLNSKSVTRFAEDVFFNFFFSIFILFISAYLTKILHLII